MPQADSMVLPPRLPLVVTTQNRGRSFNKDSRLVNCYLETNEQGELWVYKRPGTLEFQSQGAANARGLYYWQSDVYSIFAGTLYRNGVSVATGLEQTGGTYRFSSILGATPKMVLGNGQKTYAYTVAGGLTSDLHTIDVDFPLTTVKGIVYLNGATYVMDSTGQIWGSAINSVSVAGDWTALNFIAAQAEPDQGVYLAKQLVYVVAFGQWSTEIFFDAGNPAGSPLGVVQGSQISYGCATAESVQDIDDRLFLISATKSGAIQVSMIEQLNHQVISTKPIDRLLQSSTLADVSSARLKIEGHSFYIITLRDINLTLVYDIAEGEWHQWTDTNGAYFKMMAYTYDSSHRHIFQHETDGKLYYVDPSYKNDNTGKIIVDIYTPTFDANTRRRKHLSMMSFVGDQDEGSILFIRSTDDDYKTWNNFRQVNLDQKDPYITNEGTFTKRAYHFRHTANTGFRLQAAEVQYDLGTL
jgi:hypothetical protein